jgi:6-phosphogluconolactonase
MTTLRYSRRRLLGLALGGIAVPQAMIGGRRAMARGTPDTIVYVSNAGDPTVSIMAMNRASGALDLIEKTPIPDTDKPSPTSMPLALSPDRRFLYAALRSEPFVVASFAIDPASGRLKHLGNTPLAASMAYIITDRSGRFLLAASYPQSLLAINPIDTEHRAQTPPVQVLPTKPKAHCVLVDAANKFAYCTNLGGDIIMQLKFDAATGMVSPNTPAEIATKPGAGPRHMAFHPSGRFLFLITETTATIGSYAVDKTNGTLKELQFVDMMTPGYKGEIAAADLHVTPDGHFLYGSERKTSTIVGFRIDPANGTLSPIGRWATETTPRGFAIDPRGRFLLAVGLDSNQMTVYAIGKGNGRLDPVKQYPMGKMPNWVEFVDLP